MNVFSLNIYMIYEKRLLTFSGKSVILETFCTYYSEAFLDVRHVAFFREK